MTVLFILAVLVMLVVVFPKVVELQVKRFEQLPEDISLQLLESEMLR